MKILLLEYISGGGLAGQPLPDSLAREGLTMALALAQDLLDLPQVELSLPWDARLPVPAVLDQPRVHVKPVSDAASFAACWSESLLECAAVWPVAPETGGVLENLCLAVEQADRCLLNSPARAVALAAGKRATAQRLIAQGIAAVPCFAWQEVPDSLPWPRVVKPDDGVGCDGAFRLDDAAAWAAHCHAPPPANTLVQPYLAGPALSLSALFYRGDAKLLTVNRQRIETGPDGAFVLQGCEVDCLADESGVYAGLARRIAQAIPELAGYAGVDFIQSAEGPRVLEINPRLTSSYAGLRRALGQNPAALVLELFERGALPDCATGVGRKVWVSWHD
ncbi:MAG: ATP-grasp domain-containing protein [Methylococcaceae bacterium]|nr:MAG: ATP-grasp domain-containing protein [Methylococcaceae bacterium]